MPLILDPQEHIDIFDCPHGVRINAPDCLECDSEQAVRTELPGGPILLILVLAGLGLLGAVGLVLHAAWVVFSSLN